MSLTELIVLLVIAAICGGIGQSLAGYDLGGCLVSIVVGFIGAYIGMWMASKFGLPELFTVKIGGKTFPIIWSILGSAVFTFIVAMIRRGTSGSRRY
ncbi:MAG: GlsB/YeaQ/YmgE family stress response membrane protein [Flavitalea sp.]